MSQDATLSRWETVKLHWLVIVPFFLRGITVPNRWAAGLSVWIANRNGSRGFLDRLSKKYRHGVFHTRIFFSRTVLVVNPAQFDEILASSDITADPALKKRVISQLLPDALTVLSGPHWVRQRLFHLAILDTGERHRFADAFFRVVDSEVERLSQRQAAQLNWREFETLAVRIAHQLMFGAERSEPALGERLDRMARRSNLVWWGRDQQSFRLFHARMNRLIADVAASHSRSAEHAPAQCPPPCLLTAVGDQSRIQDLESLPALSSQLGFWLLVLKDALELHLPRTLALIAAHPDVQQHVQQEIDRAGVLSGAALDQLGLLDRCISEQLRLWTPVPMLFRRTQNDCTLNTGAQLARDRQVVLMVGHYHRHAGSFQERADRFSPESQSDVPPTYCFSAARQSCAGEQLARLILKSALASVLGRYTLTLRKPGIDTRRIPAAVNHFAISLKADRRRPDPI